MSKPEIGKPPAREKPSPFLSGGMRRIVYMEPPSFTEVSEQAPITEAEFERRAGVSITPDLPSGAKITKVSLGPEGYNLEYSFLQEQLVTETVTREQFLEGMGTKYHVTDLARIAQEHPEFLDVDYSSQWIQQTKGQGPKLLYRQLLEGRAKPEWLGLPEMAEVTKVEGAEEGLQLTYTMPREFKEPSFAEVHLGPYAPIAAEYILSEFALRRFWDPAYRQRMLEMKEAYEETRTPTEREYISQLRSQQIQLAVSAAIIGYTAFDIGRSLYHIAKWRGATKPVILEGAEIQEEPFTYTQITGAKGARTALTSTYETQLPQPEKFEVTWTRGTQITPMSATLEKVLKSKEAITTLPRLLTWPTQVLETQVPLGMYHPRFLTETMFAGIALGSLPQAIQKPRFTVETRATIIPQAKSFLESRIDLSSSQLLFHEAQRTLQLQSQATQQLQLQRQLQIQKQTFAGDLFLGFGKRKRGRSAFDLWGRYKRLYPVMTGKEVMKVKPKDFLW